MSVRPPESVAVNLNSEVRRVLVVGRGEGPARHPYEVLQRMRMTVRWAVLHDQLPRQRRGRQRAVFRIGGRA